jgi:hypothetical protein
MSFSIRTDLHCDECSEYFEGSISSFKVEKTYVWSCAKKSGWKKIKSKHLCDECLKSKGLKKLVIAHKL